MTKRVAVLGCGPAGLLAAHAAQLHGYRVNIYAPEPTKSVISGAQFLHSAIPGITDLEPDGYITVEHHGDEQGYAHKVYGAQAKHVTTSWNAYPDRVPVPSWSLRQAYALLWRCYKSDMLSATVQPDDISQLAIEYDHVFSTAPRPLMQNGVRTLESVWIKEYPAVPCPQQTVIYSGEPEVLFYRMSSIFGHYSVEWPSRTLAVGVGAVKIQKPLAFVPAELAPDNVHFVGRYGQWQKGVLVDHVFQYVDEILRAE